MMKCYIFLILLTIFNLSCSIATPPVIITGEQTSVEKQIIGEYRELEKNAWVLSSPRHSVQWNKKSNVSYVGDEKSFSAMKIREFHFDKIRKFKDQGLLGETRFGFIAYRFDKLFERDKEKKRLLNILISEENKARGILFRRALIISEKKNITDDDIKNIGMSFAKDQKNMAKKGDYIQDANGKWVKVK